jgi:hypothetical protein
MFIPSAPGDGSGESALPPNGIGVPCAVADPNLELCIDFEGSVTPYAVDSSGQDRPAATTWIVPIVRGDQQAVEVGPGAELLIAGNHAPLMSVPLTVELWVRPAGLPDDDAAIVDSQGFGVRLHSDGSVSCDVAGASTRGGMLQPGQWSHIACTYDGDRAITYAGGDVVACSPGGDGDARVDDDGRLRLAGRLEDGSHVLSGAIDNVHVYGSLLGGDQVCTLAGRHKCASMCPM